MKIDFQLKENVNGTKYKLEIYSEDGRRFKVCENDSAYRTYDTREDFLKDFSDLKQWFWK